ncbi:esterase [Bizionia argentinensis JUB59]|uniref:Esterase n=1 Tax=Bizionia argentinensis JUB59 TaxID=1046627 RepID=G2EH46_9FLAO|nr:alpha/beta hydrolase-fold protein [Bizionia argentinensis]EGV42241.2 esterase [Bizionia argentinensis JUB59]
MKKTALLFVLFFSASILYSQVIYHPLESAKLGETREIKIQLPRGYDTNTDKSYPVIVVLDGDYMFEVVAGNVDYYSYWEDMPESIVVGINQVGSRSADVYYSEQNSLPMDTGATFYEFLSMELLPYINKTYRTVNFRAIVGHDRTANFINYFLLKEKPLFQAYVAVSPDLAPDMQRYLVDKLPKLESYIFYYLATSENDIDRLKSEAVSLNAKISGIESNNLLFKFDMFDKASHYALPAHAIPNALEDIFFVFQAISKTEYTDTILKLEGSPVIYLSEKYETIKTLFDIDKPILINDFNAIEAAINKSEKFEYLEELGKIARKQYPDTLLGNYYIARFYEETGSPKKAMKAYQNAFVLEEFGGITKEEVLRRADAIKADFGY